MAVYGQPKMLEKWWETLRVYPPHVLKELHLVIVDDHGTPPVAVPKDIQKLLEVRLFRVKDNIPWNQMGARNLGAVKAETNWLLLLDPDMVVEPEVAERLVQRVKGISKGDVVKLLLRYKNGKLDPSSPNVYLIHRRDFARVGGYDEDYAGHKGWSDVQFLHALTGSKMRFLQPKGLWVRYYRPDEISDATVTSLDRSVKHNRSLHIRKMPVVRRNWKAWARQNWARTIRFRWERLL